MEGGLGVGVQNPSFDQLVVLLQAEHRRVVAELDTLRPAGGGGAAEAGVVQRQPSRRSRQVAPGIPGSVWALTAARLENWKQPRALEWKPHGGDDAAPNDPPLLRVPTALRGRVGDRGSDDMTSIAVGMGASTSSEARAKAGTNVDLDSRWHDLYQANEAAATAASLMDSRREWGSMKCARSLRFDLDGWRNYECFKKVPLRPHGRGRLLWDLLGAIFILYSLVAIPVEVAWDLTSINGIDVITLVYWVADIIVSFNTAHVREGVLVLSRSAVAKHYVANRFLFDVLLTTCDAACLFVTTPRSNTTVAILHLVRLARVVNVTRTSDNLEELCIDLGLQWLIVVYTVVQIVLSVFVVGHLFSCAWCGMGVHARFTGSFGWIDHYEADFGEGLSIGNQYLRAHSWISGHLLSAPIDRVMTLRSDDDHLFALCLIWVKLFVMGAGISKITGAIAELGRANAQSKDAKRKLHQVIQKAGLSKDASSRMIRFALHSASSKRASNLDPAISGLLSSTMAKELVVGQRMRTLSLHPLFNHISLRHSDIFSTLCSAFTPQVYADFEEVFVQGTLSERMYITCSGSWAISGTESSSGSGSEFDGIVWLCEVSLFARVLHTRTLVTRTFADSLTLTCSDLELCIRTSPACIVTIYRYARQLLSLINREDYDMVSLRIAQVAMDTAICRNMPEFPALKTITLSSSVKFSSAFDNLRSRRLKAVEELMQPILPFFPEATYGTGIYAGLEMDSERRRTVCALSSITVLLCDRHDLFTLEQAEHSRITDRQWEELQDVMRWLEPSQDMVHVVLAFLTIRGLSKSKLVLNTLGAYNLSPEEVLLLVVEKKPEIAPCCEMLSDDQKELLRQSIRFHTMFNFAQFLQGENSPFQIHAFQASVAAEGDAALKAYLLQIVGVMCGIRGDENPNCSLFMDAKNATTLITGLEVFRHLGTSSPQAIYWHYIASRAQQLRLPTENAEHFVFARIACLTRGRGAANGEVEAAWRRLNQSEQEALTDLLLSDGITRQNFVLKFLPAFFASAFNNPHVGLHSAFIVLVDMLESMKSSAFGRPRRARSCVVNMQDLASFTDKVRCSSVFLAVAGYLSFLEKASEVTVVVATAHMQRTSQRSWAESPAQEAALLVRRMRRQFAGFDGLRDSVGRSPAGASCSPVAQASVFSLAPFVDTVI